jgi:STE24 endopeptidase
MEILALNPDTVLTLAFVVALLASTAVQLWLDARQARHVARHRGAVPTAFAGTVPLAAHQKAAGYTVAKTRLHSALVLVNAVVLLGWTLLGGLDALNGLVKAFTLGWGPMAYQLALAGAFVAVGSAIDLPAALYRTFVLEQRFGFNRMTLRMWLADMVKGTLVGIVIGLPMAWLVLVLMRETGSLWWLWAWAAWIAFQAVLLVLYPTVIAPLFNTFSPLPDETLKQRVQGLMQRCGFQAKGLFVMDGSRRSAHGNAYFTGLGAAKRVVFFDTLLARLNHGEVEAVLAHELGHFHHKHVIRRTVLMTVLAFVAFALLGWLSSRSWFYEALGVVPNAGSAPDDALALILFVLVLPSFVFFVAPLISRRMRADEFQADAYASGQTSAAALKSALLKLYEDNASTLTPDPMYTAFYASHPPASQRLAALAAFEGLGSVPTRAAAT